ncbi:MAG: T9SS type A sorting domain-containing protein [bacterium]|nr:T9SS type A sorting domain-containing protein [bacterium]
MKKLILFVFITISSIGFGQLALPIDFEGNPTSYVFTDFDGGSSSVIANPDMTGINTSANVGRMIKNTGQPWGGSYLEMAAPIDFSTNKIFTMKVWSPNVGRRVLLKVENATNGAIFFEKEDTSTVANAWEELTFDFTAINTANSYQKIVLIWDLGTVGDGTSNFTFYFDDIELVASTGPVLDQIDLPVTFEDTTVDYTLTDFGGNAHQVIADPTNPNNTVAEVTKTQAAQFWAGTTISTPNGLASAIPFSATDSTISVRVWSPDSGIPVRLKAEDHTNPTISVETENLTTTSGEWETMIFNFNNEVGGTAAINLANTYDMLSIFFNFGTDGATAGEKIYYFDDVQMGPPCQVSSTEDVSLCDAVSYDWNGTTYTMDGTYTYTTQNAGECDSTATLNLTFASSTTSSITETALDTYTAPSGAVYTTSGTYNDTITNAAGCDSVITIDLTVQYTGINEYDLSGVTVSPNPAADYVTITVDEALVSQSIFVVDQAGRIVIELNANTTQTDINISELESGIYYVSIGNLKAVKLLKE